MSTTRGYRWSCALARTHTLPRRGRDAAARARPKRDTSMSAGRRDPKIRSLYSLNLRSRESPVLPCDGGTPRTHRLAIAAVVASETTTAARLPRVSGPRRSAWRMGTPPKPSRATPSSAAYFDLVSDSRARANAPTEGFLAELAMPAVHHSVLDASGRADSGGRAGVAGSSAGGS